MSLGQMSNIPPSILKTYVDGKLAEEKVYIKNNLKASGAKLYFLSIPKALLSVTIDLVRALSRINFTSDIFFAQHFLPAFVAIHLRRLGILKCRKIVFWMFDFFPIPPEFLRGMYYRGMDVIQGYTRSRVDEIWYTTPRLLEADEDRFGKPPETVTRRLTEGCFFRRIPAAPPAPVPPLRLGFLGSLRRDTAIYETIDVVGNCIHHGLDVRLEVIGSGPEDTRLRSYVKAHRLTGQVRFHGFVDDGAEIAGILSGCHLGMALYPAQPYSPNWFLTSGKFRRYISQRLPVITTTVPYFAKYLSDYHAGLVVDNDPDRIRTVLEGIYRHPALLTRLRIGADRLYKKYKGDTILEEKFNMLLRQP